MIRRGFWLLAGAALGVTGYRKASRLARTLTGQGLAGGPAGARNRGGSVRGVTTGTAGRIGTAGRTGRAGRIGTVDRTGTADRTGRAGRRLARPAQPEAKPAARIAAAAAHASAAAGFVRDVRDGMAEYWDLHRGESGLTLESRRDALWSGDGQRGSRDH